MDNNNNQKEILALVERSLDDFRQGMEFREQLSIRIGRRTTQIIRFGMAGNMHQMAKPMKVFPFQ